MQNQPFQSKTPADRTAQVPASKTPPSYPLPSKQRSLVTQPNVPHPHLPVTQASILQMQKQVGNRAVTQFLYSQVQQQKKEQVQQVVQAQTETLQLETEEETRTQLKKTISEDSSDLLEQLAKKDYGKLYRITPQKWIDQYLDTKLDAYLNTYGTKNSDLIRLKIQQEVGSLLPLQTELLDLMSNTISQIPDPMKSSKNMEIIKHALYPASKDDPSGQSFAEKELSQYNVSFAQKQSARILQNLKTVSERVQIDWEELSHTFGLIGDLKSIHLTGSDFHNEGQQVCILESTKGSKAVYKPRSVSPDQALVGEKESAFQQLNEIGEGSLSLPTMNFLEKNGKKEDQHYSYVEFQEHEDLKQPDEVKQYYRQYGQMVVATKLLGVTDLHQENIMATKDKPQIIDAETSFLPYIWSDASYAVTGITAALRSFMVGDDLTNNHFLTTSEKEAWSKMDRDTKVKNGYGSYADYIRIRRRNDLIGECNYLQEFKQGIHDVQQVVAKKKEEVTKMILTKVANVRDIRVVPVATLFFTGSIRRFQESLQYGEVEAVEQHLISDQEVLEKSLLEKGFVLSGKDQLVGGLREDYSMRDTPIFHFDPIKNALVYRGKNIGSHKDWVAPEALIEKVVSQIASTDVDQVMESLKF